jgi:hypothetical protein
MTQLFAEPESPDDLDRYNKFWKSVVDDAERSLRDVTQTAHSKIPIAEYSYLRAIFGGKVLNAYADLKQAFRISKHNDFNLLLICDEARILCDILALDGQIIFTDLNFNPEKEVRSPAETNYPLFSNFRAFRRALRYLMLAKLRAESHLYISNQDNPVSKKHWTIHGPSEGGSVDNSMPRIFALLMDTSSRLTNFQPAAWENRSMRHVNLPYSATNNSTPYLRSRLSTHIPCIRGGHVQPTLILLPTRRDC